VFVFVFLCVCVCVHAGFEIASFRDSQVQEFVSRSLFLINCAPVFRTQNVSHAAAGRSGQRHPCRPLPADGRIMQFAI